MRIKIIILLIFLLTFLLITPLVLFYFDGNFKTSPPIKNFTNEKYSQKHFYQFTQGFYRLNNGNINGQTKIGAIIILFVLILINFIKFLAKYIYGIIGLSFIIYIVYTLIHNEIIKNLYKREWNNNDKKFIAQRCYEDGFGYDKDGKLLNQLIRMKKNIGTLFI